MERFFSIHDCKFYTMLKEVLLNLNLTDKEYWWLITDIEAYPTKKEYEEFIYKDDYLLITTSELLKMVNDDDFQWVWGAFCVIPMKYSKEEILKHELPYIRSLDEGGYNPYAVEPKLQHPLAEFELYAVDSSYMIIITDNGDIIHRFKKGYPLFTDKHS